MKESINILKNELSLDKTVNLKKLIGKNVLSKGGKMIGKVIELRVHPKNLGLEGIIVKGPFIPESMYIGKSYFSSLSEEAIILNIEVSVLIKNKQVINSEGKIMGRVKEVVRNGTRNDLKGLYAKSLLSKQFFIPESAIDYIGDSVVLRTSYDGRKKYLWQKDK